jgi:hypothetical protein
MGIPNQRNFTNEKALQTLPIFVAPVPISRTNLELLQPQKGRKD